MIVVPEQTLLSEAEMVRSTGRGLVTVISMTFDSANPVQSVMQSTLAIRLYHVFCAISPGLKLAVLLPAMSVKPVVLLVVESCHLYSRVPVCPEGKTRFEIEEGVKLPQPP